MAISLRVNLKNILDRFKSFVLKIKKCLQDKNYLKRLINIYQNKNQNNYLV